MERNEYRLLADGVEVVVTRKIRVGGTYHINSSMGMSGIIDGEVTILQIIHPADMEPNERENTVTLWQEISVFEEGDDYYEEHMDMICNHPWVQYQYDPSTKMVEDEIQWIPLEVFADHLSQR